MITMIMCDFCALSPDQRRTMLDKFRDCLEPHGAVLFDVYSIQAFEAKQEAVEHGPNLMGGFWSAAPYFGFLNVVKYPSDKVTLDKYTIVEETRVREVFNWLQYYDRDTLRREIVDRGLVIEELLGDVAGSPFDAESHELAVIATKR